MNYKSIVKLLRDVNFPKETKLFIFLIILFLFIIFNLKYKNYLYYILITVI